MYEIGITCRPYMLCMNMCNVAWLRVYSQSWLLLLCRQPSFWTPVTHLASVWGPWLSSCSAGTGGQQQWRGPCQPPLTSQTFLSVGCGEKMQNKDSICAAGPVDVWALSGNTAGWPTWRAWLVLLQQYGGQCCQACVVEFTVLIPVDPGFTITTLSCTSCPVMRKTVRL